MIRLDVTLARFIVVGPHHVIEPDPRGHAAVMTLAASVLEPAIIGLTLLATWPASRTIHYLWRYLIGLPLLLLMLPLDIPFVLLGELWEIIIKSSVQHDFSPLLVWNDFLQQGGRQGACVVYRDNYHRTGATACTVCQIVRRSVTTVKKAFLVGRTVHAMTNTGTNG